MVELRPVEESLASVPSPKQSDVDDHSCTSKNVASVGTQWEDHIFEEHSYGGRCSDKFITCDSGILEYLHPGDEVMVDRGF
uniref:DDE Tnp4 domain-containing protein n=1 Tax=Sinocyclocheilus anshuiensis TaxID=1608454 RepID=A0A671M9M8_9TELE